VPPPGKPPLRAEHPVVLVMATVTAFTGAPDGRALGVAAGVGRVPALTLEAVMQSPTLMADRLALARDVNRVVLANATSVLPLEVVTFAPALPTEATLPVTAVPPAPTNPRPVPVPPSPPLPSRPLPSWPLLALLLGEPAEPDGLEPELLPHAARTAAQAAIATVPVMRREVEDGRCDTEVSWLLVLVLVLGWLDGRGELTAASLTA
jgi:hypothetical protein